MDTESAAGFWSYTHADDDGEQTRIVSLARHLITQYRLATGGEILDLFIDKDILWGEEWEKRIGGAIAGTTFFIPIITPSYIKSQACRDELLEFIGQAETAGLQKLVMPIYWRTVPELETHPEASLDLVIRIIHAYQYKDFRDARLEDEQSSLFRKALDDLAEELVKRAGEAETVHDLPTPTAAAATVADPRQDDTARDYPEYEVSEGENELGLMEKLAIGEDALPEIVAIIEGVGKELQEVNRIATAANDAFSETAAKGRSAKAGLVVTEQFAHDLTPPALRLEQLGSEYADKLARVGAGVEAQLELVSDATGPLDEEARSELNSIVGLASIVDEVAAELQGLIDASAPLVRMSRSLRAPIRHLRAGLQGIVDGRPTIVTWAERATDVMAKRDGPEGQVGTGEVEPA